MNRANSLGLKPERKTSHPVDPRRRVFAEGRERRCDEILSNWRMASARLFWTIGAGREPGDRVVLVVSHQGNRITTIDHAPNSLEGPANFWPAIHVIPKEDRGPISVPRNAIDPLVVEAVQQIIEPSRMSMQITDEIETPFRINGEVVERSNLGMGIVPDILETRIRGRHHGGKGRRGEEKSDRMGGSSGLNLGEEPFGLVWSCHIVEGVTQAEPTE